MILRKVLGLKGVPFFSMISKQIYRRLFGVDVGVNDVLRESKNVCIMSVCSDSSYDSESECSF